MATVREKFSAYVQVHSTLASYSVENSHSARTHVQASSKNVNTRILFPNNYRNINTEQEIQNSLKNRNKHYGFTEEQKQRDTENTKIQNSLKNKNKKYGKYGRTEFRKFLVMRHLYSHSLAMLAHACVQNDYFLFQSS